MLTEGWALVIVDLKSVRHVDFEPLLVELKGNKRLLQNEQNNKNIAMMWFGCRDFYLSSLIVMSNEDRKPLAVLGQGHEILYQVTWR